jgi:CubicO group peptidase (beta-lactamase class C family)
MADSSNAISRRGLLQRAALTVPLGAMASAPALATPQAAAAVPSERPAGAAYSAGDVLRFHTPPEIGNMYRNPPARMRYMFLNMTEFMRHGRIARGSANVRSFRVGEANGSVVGSIGVDTPLGRMRLDEYVRHPGSGIDSLIVLRGDSVHYEAYPRMRPTDLHIIWSVTKSVVGLLVGVLVDRNQIDPKRDLAAYIGEFAGTDWEGIAIRDILDMAAGMDVYEGSPVAYIDPAHPYYRFEASIGYLPSREFADIPTYDIVSGYRRRIAPGQRYEYSSVNTFALAWLAERVTGLPLHELLATEIWSKIGAENDAFITMSPRGAPGADGGISCTLRDLGRYGTIFTDGQRRVGSRSLVSDRYLAAVRNGRRPVFLAGDGHDSGQVPDAPLFNSWQWDWVWRNGDMYKGGWGGQGLFVSPSRDIVIAYFGTPIEFGNWNKLDELVRPIADHLAG